MLLVAVELDLLVGAMHLSVHPYPGEAVAVQIFEELTVGSLLLADDRGEDGDQGLRSLLAGKSARMLSAILSGDWDSILMSWTGQ